MNMNILLFLGVKSCGLVGRYLSFGGTSCISLRWKRMQTADSSVKLLHVYQSTRCHILKHVISTFFLLPYINVCNFTEISVTL